MATLVFDRFNTEGHGTTLVVVKSPDNVLDVQELYDKAQDFQDEPGNMDMVGMIKGTGKDDLGGGLEVGITITLLDGWQVWFETLGPATQVNGGNIVALDTGGSTQPAVANTNIVTIGQASQNTIDSVTAFALETVEYNNTIWVDDVNGQGGTEYPAGTQRQPVLGWADAKTIGTARNIKEVFIANDTTVTVDTAAVGWGFTGTARNDSQVRIDGANVANANFRNVTLFTLTNPSALRRVTAVDCFVNNTQNIAGVFTRCGFGGQFKLSNSAEYQFTDCFSRIASPAIALPSFEISNAGFKDPVWTRWSGDMLITGQGQGNNNNDLWIDCVGGPTITLDSTLILGKTVVAGNCFVVDNSDAQHTVDISRLINHRTLNFRGAVWIDDVNGAAGTDYPLGTELNPVSNITDAIVIAAEQGLTTFNLMEFATLTLAAQFDGYTVLGVGSARNSTFVDLAGFSTSSQFIHTNPFGAQGGGSSEFRDCEIGITGGHKGTFVDCILFSAIAPGGLMTMIRCSGSTSFIIDNTGLTHSFSALDWQGGSITLRGFDTGAGTLEWSGVGNVTLEATCTTRTLTLMGVAEFTDNSAGMVVESGGLLTVEPGAASIQEITADQTWNEDIADHTDTTKFGGFTQTLLTIAKFLGLK